MVFRRFRSAAVAAALAADDKIADDIMVFDVKKISGVADYFVLVSVDSSPQLTAVTDHIARRLRESFRLHPLHNDGRRSDHWSAMDFGGLVVHVFRREAREFYALERMWEGARRVAWNAPQKNAVKKGSPQ
jgi:ribosome-associated protein